jgi:hypothetical protein
MAVAYSLTPELRKKLKEPLGALIRGSFLDTTNQLKAIIEDEKPPCVISVGDTVSRNLEKGQISRQLSIIDNVVMRRRSRPFPLAKERTAYVKNPQATITYEAIAAIQDSLKTNTRTVIVVDGEEDLLALIAILHAPDNSLVVYGQPYEGMVVVKTTQAKKTEIAEILQPMENARKAK